MRDRNHRPREGREEVKLMWANQDTTSVKHISLIRRYNSDCKSTRVGLSITTISPDSLQITETFIAPIEQTVCPASRTAEVKVPYRRGVVLSRMGEYQFRIKPLQTAGGICGVGINLEEHAE